MSGTAEETAPYGGASARSAGDHGPRRAGKVRTHHLREWKDAGEKFTMLTSYDLRTVRAVQDAGVFDVVHEMVPGEVAAQATKELDIPTIGIGAGSQTDGQALAWQDAFGLNTGRVPRFVKRYADVNAALLDGARTYVSEVRGGTFPAVDHTF